MSTDQPEISSPDKALFPDSGITKGDMADYYTRIASAMLPFIRNRPLTLRRFPDGIREEGFFNKHAPDYFPDFIERLSVPMRSRDQDMEMVAADETRDLVYFADQAAIEIHLGLSTADNLEAPDQMIFDLDPSDDDFGKVRKTARQLKKILDGNGWPSFVKTTGSKGLHIHVPLKPVHRFDAVKDAARQTARQLNEAAPGLTTLEQRKRKRGDKVFIDILRNDYAMTAIAPYSLRALEGAPLATPIDWEEVGSTDLTPRRYTLSNIFRRLAHKKDPWRGFAGAAINL